MKVKVRAGGQAEGRGETGKGRERTSGKPAQEQEESKGRKRNREGGREVERKKTAERLERLGRG